MRSMVATLRQEPTAHEEDTADLLPHKKLHLLLNLLDMHGMSETCECLKQEAARAYGGGEAIEKLVPLETLILPDAQDATQRNLKEFNGASQAHAKEFESFAQDLVQQKQHLGSLQSRMLKVLGALKAKKGVSSQEREAKLEWCEVEVEKLQEKIMQMQSDEHDMRQELDQVVQETGSLQRTLEESVDAETKAKIQLECAREEFEKLMQQIHGPPVITPARVIQGILSSWSDSDSPILAMIQDIFTAVDTDKDGHLQWNNDEIKGFVRLLFARNNVQVPSWQDHVWYDMYRRADVDGSYSLEIGEATRFARLCFEAALAFVLLPDLGNRDGFSTVEHWVSPAAKTRNVQGNPAKILPRTDSKKAITQRLFSAPQRQMSIKASVLARPNTQKVMQVPHSVSAPVGAAVRSDSPVRVTATVPVVRPISPVQQRGRSPHERLTASVKSVSSIQEMMEKLNPHVERVLGTLPTSVSVAAVSRPLAVMPATFASPMTMPPSPMLMATSRPTSPHRDDSIQRKISLVGSHISPRRSRSVSPQRLMIVPTNFGVPTYPVRARSASPVPRGAIPAGALPFMQEIRILPARSLGEGWPVAASGAAVRRDNSQQ